MSNVIIIGHGPAGISCALYTVRAGISTTIIGRDSGALGRAEKIENYYGFENPISGKQLVSDSIAQAVRLGATIIQAEVVGLSFDEGFIVKTHEGEYKADAVVIATGSTRFTPKITGIDLFEGKGISYCAVCDAFFYRNKQVAVLGSGNYAISEALELLPIVKSVTLLTNGETPKLEIPPQISVDTRKIASFKGNTAIEAVEFSDNSTLMIAGVFIAVGVAGSSDLAKKIGAQTNGNKIAIDNAMSTTIPGLYAAGDCTGGLLQIAKAVYEGAKAGTEIVKQLRKK